MVKIHRYFTFSHPAISPTRFFRLFKNISGGMPDIWFTGNMPVQFQRQNKKTGLEKVGLT
jgi:hypothetical protein